MLGGQQAERPRSHDEVTQFAFASPIADRTLLVRCHGSMTADLWHWRFTSCVWEKKVAVNAGPSPEGFLLRRRLQYHSALRPVPLTGFDHPTLGSYQREVWPGGWRLRLICPHLVWRKEYQDRQWHYASLSRQS